ncbi:unnamed protein product [Caenorhabditis bovis]|uniref:BTB domain-containing protein n=1 Tax=Caenorhabditis bovis TaxID=2654633 RepID=A0A8S1FBJ3_9PELO|nr:unnamed protein product [Caenorhabditis bovis]
MVVVQSIEESARLLSIFTEPFSSFLRSIPIEFEEFSPSQKIDDAEDDDQDLEACIDADVFKQPETQQASHNLHNVTENATLHVVEQSNFQVIREVVNCLLNAFEPPTTTISTCCSFIRAQQSARTRSILPDTRHIATLAPVQATFREPKKKKTIKSKKMAAEVCQVNEPHCFIASPSTVDRPFKLLVQKETFLIDAASMSRISPIFNIMCFGKDFEKMDLSREIVDEKSVDINCFLRAVHDTSIINSSNFALVLRLSNKYQVEPVIEACQQYIMRQHLDVLKPDEILNMLIAAYEHHCKKEVLHKLIRRLASEGNSVFTKLKISRYLPAQVYGAVISTSMNLNQMKEHEAMNGHVLKTERNKIRWRQSVCDECKVIHECSNCEECKKALCREHVEKKKCANDYGSRLTEDLRKKIVDFEWND